MVFWLGVQVKHNQGNLVSCKASTGRRKWSGFACSLAEHYSRSAVMQRGIASPCPPSNSVAAVLCEKSYSDNTYEACPWVFTWVTLQRGLISGPWVVLSLMSCQGLGQLQVWAGGLWSALINGVSRSWSSWVGQLLAERELSGLVFSV